MASVTVSSVRGLIFFVPLPEAALGAATGAAAGQPTDVDIDHDVIEQVRETIVPGFVRAVRAQHARGVGQDP